jgi:hypothetical protein
MLVSVKAGGPELDLVVASTLIIFDIDVDLAGTVNFECFGQVWRENQKQLVTFR